MQNRRNFIKQLATIGAIGVVPSSLGISGIKENEKIWGALLHLSFNMWEEYISPHRPFRGYRPYLRLSESLWNDAVRKMADVGLNMVVIDLGDGVKYESHPEIAVKNAWSVNRLSEELKKIRDLGMEPIPKLNFSAAHNTWMKEYSRMVSSDIYHSFCKDIVEEVIRIFEKPRFFHLGMDEETAGHQSHYLYTTVRKGELWWSDFFSLISQVQNEGSQPWIWSDYVWDNEELFFKNMPKSVVQSNWYYGEDFSKKLSGGSQKWVDAYLKLEEHKYYQIPTGSYHEENENSFINTIKFCSENIEKGRLLGFLQTFWKPTIEEYRERILKGISLAGEAKKWYEKNKI